MLFSATVLQIIFPSSVFLRVFESFSQQCQLMVFILGISDSKPPQVSRTLHSILVDLDNAVVCMVLMISLISNTSAFFFGLWGQFKCHHFGKVQVLHLRFRLFSPCFQRNGKNHYMTSSLFLLTLGKSSKFFSIFSYNSCILIFLVFTVFMYSQYSCILSILVFSLFWYSQYPCVLIVIVLSVFMYSQYSCIFIILVFSVFLYSHYSCILIILVF